ncbi:MULTISPECIES: hypothetical protein [unclassified Novosphingobium]|uniref:hypothetical protein n=1 Tax=unclassified Novosphingobium TaxID=2644732 RepID=UPI001494236B|nr:MULTISPECIES: hypothetical protein [unclassified Novosphingobium]MBB3356913.1 GAF domain-containing protein [Novosphingobium sp. BK256]MBB3373314.1 GAF domain-containing protein [Novosphingobium sp. BK280]MBB3377683.1 GAF domain-containing protein [Novosphingobium sp. BK258]MBB3418906.1 GAF domain-containing protein [Novosphingobium sp. BK267]MBB3450259.1 GAF domain-containing protein [Novosphingobium sp. BK352]
MSDAPETTESDELFEIARRLARGRSYEQVIEVVRSAARSIIGAQGITFVRCEGDECAYIAEDAIEPLWEGQRFKLSQCVSGWVIENGEAAVIPDNYADDRVPQALGIGPVLNGRTQIFSRRRAPLASPMCLGLGN